MEATIKKTRIAATRDRHENQIKHVCGLLKWTHEQYCWHQYEQYERFVRNLTTYYPELRTWLRYSSVFRGFWNNEWAARNESDFLAFVYESKYDQKEMLQEYLHINDAMRLINDDEFYNRFENILKLI